MRVIDRTTETARTTTLNDIPVGQVFRGSIARVDGTWTPLGVYYKAEGPVRIGNREMDTTVVETDVVVVRLDAGMTGVSGNGRVYRNLAYYCRTVRNYEPLDVELVIKGVL